MEAHTAIGLPLLCLAALGLASAPSAAEDARSSPLSLAEAGRTGYRIIIGQEADPAEEFAAEELRTFLVGMTGARFVMRRDSHSPVAREIVVGRTNRFDLSRAPADVLPKSDEGFLLDRRDRRLIIAGNTPRATLYGVYDFLEVELGCRFLASGVDHIPSRPDLTLPVTPRHYDPPLEYRNIYSDERWAVRSRLNATWGWAPMEKLLGGVRFVGPSFVHTFGYLVPSETHFADHPEYYALVDGERRPTEGGVSGQLCLTQPDVLRIATQAAREWISGYSVSPHSRLVVSISPNDNGMVCECPGCAEVNREERSQSGTLVRFVNAVARALRDEFPGVRVETLAYGPSLQPPAVARPEPNVLIRFAPIGADFGKPLADPTSEMNRPTWDSLTRWSEMGARVYVWHYVVNFHSYCKPFPNLRVLGTDLRSLRERGMVGLYAQGSQTPGSDLRALRDYLIAKLMWRPETDPRATVGEFCRLYYGAGAPGVLEYVELVHDCFMRQGKPLHWNDASRADGVVYDDAFLMEADALLARAEAAAETPAQKQRVATERLTVWYQTLQRALGRAGQPGGISDGVREAAKRFTQVSQEVGVTHLSEFYGPPGEQFEKEFRPKVEALLRKRPGSEAPPGVVRQAAAFLGNTHHTYRVIPEETALDGSCAVQTADRTWTLGQAMAWSITEALDATEPRYRLRARIKVAATGKEGLAFRFGYARQHADYSADICAEVQVRADQITDGDWHWYELPEAVTRQEAANGQFAFIWPADNAANITAVYLDAIELMPVGPG